MPTVLSPVHGRGQEPPQNDVVQMIQVGREGMEALLVVPHLKKKDNPMAPKNGALASTRQLLRPRVPISSHGTCVRPRGAVPAWLTVSGDPRLLSSH